MLRKKLMDFWLSFSSVIFDGFFNWLLILIHSNVLHGFVVKRYHTSVAGSPYKLKSCDYHNVSDQNVFYPLNEIFSCHNRSTHGNCYFWVNIPFLVATSLELWFVKRLSSSNKFFLLASRRCTHKRIMYQNSHKVFTYFVR